MKKKNNGIYILISTIIFCVFGYYITNNILFHLEKNGNIVTIDDKGISAGVEKIYDAFVSVNVVKENQVLGAGSGFVISKDGYILTNHHVTKDNNSYSVVIGEEYVDAEFVGSDPYIDVAVLKIDSKYVKGVATIGNSKDSKIGDTIFTVGTPVSIKYAGTVTRGIISGKNRLIETSSVSNNIDWLLEVIQIDAAINNGNSGGPLCNVNGEVIGINTLKLSNTGVDSMAFAVPIETAMEYANKIIKGEDVDRPMLGIRMSDSFNSSHLNNYDINIDASLDSGVVVIEPLLDGPASKAGILKGDIIVKINDVSISSIPELNYNMFKYKSGEEITLTIIRKKETLNVKVMLGKKEK